MERHAERSVGSAAGALALAAATLVTLVHVAPAPAAATPTGGRACATAPTFHPGHLGAIAYVRGRTLHVVDVSSGSDRAVAVLPPGPPGAPAWSPAGDWIAVGSVLVAAGSEARCQPFGSGVFGLAWAPRRDLLAATSEKGVLVGGPGLQTRVLLPKGFASAVFDPTGRRLAVEGPGAVGSLFVVEVASGRRRRIYTSPSLTVGPPIVRGWSPDGRWVLFQTDPFRSNSIAADGLPLRAGQRARSTRKTTIREKLVPSIWNA